METERDFKAKALGVVGQEKKLKADFSHEASKQKILETLQDERVGLVMFCRGCGSYHGVKKAYVESAEKILERKIVPTEEYAETFSCALCDSKDDRTGFKRISDLKEE